VGLLNFFVVGKQGIMSWHGRSIAALLSIGLQIFAAESDEVSPWDVTFTLKEAVGNKDNLLLSDFNKESSLFTQTTGDLFIYRVPIDGWEFAGFSSIEDRRYWQSSTVDKEQLFMASADLKRSIGEAWKAGLNFQYFYNDQMFDASVLEGVPLRIQARMHRFSGGPTVQWNLPGKRRLELSGVLVRQNFEQPLDDSWEGGPKLLFGQKFGIASDFTASVQWRKRMYDTRSAPGPGVESLRFDQKELEFGLKHTWDEAKHWKSRFRAGVEFNEDNGSGFFDYRKWRLSKEVTFTTGKFEATLQAKWLHYEYATQTGFDGTVRRRSELVLGGRVEYGIIERLKAFAELEHEWVMATDPIDRYHATTIMVGVDWQVK
jgi:hypothetical protein